MNVFHRFTRQSLRKNRSRTWVTIVGIVLSVAMFTAVTEGAYSGVRYLVRTTEYTVGRFHGCYQNLTEQQATQLSRDEKEITEMSAWQTVGWGNIGSQNEYKPYLRIMSMDPDLPDLLSIRLTQGRLPEKAGELLLPEHLWSNGSVRHALGDTMELELGHRTLGGEELTADDPYTKGETLTDTTPHTYTVVGFYQRLDMTTEPFSCPGYTALTCQEQGYQTDEFFRVAHPSRFYSYMEGNAEKYPGLAWYSNSTLLNYYGATTFFSVNRMIYSFAVILLLMISFGSVSLIYNSFSISVAERTRQFGILKSVGATKKQIRGSVLYEALVLCAVGIPLGLLVGCLGIGVTLYCLRGSFGFLPGGESGGAVEMRFVLNLWALLAAAGIGLITAVISAWIPARRAVRLSPIEAIRQTQDVKIRSREVKTSPLTGKLFGFSGMLAAKNFKRDRKRYRSTVVGLFLSVTLFISASSFCAYLTGAVTRLSSDGMGVQLYYSEALPEDVTPEQRLGQLSAAHGVESGFYTADSYSTLSFAGEDMDPEYWSDTVRDGTGESRSVSFYFLQDGDFRQLLRENGLAEDDYFRAGSPRAAAWDALETWRGDGGDHDKLYRYRLLNGNRLPITGTETNYQPMEGWFTEGERITRDGAEYVLYYPVDYMDTYYEAREQGEAPDTGQARAVPVEEAVNSGTYTVGAILKERPAFLNSDNGLVLLYPYSMYEAVTGQARPYALSFWFRSGDHAAAYESMGRVLTELGLSRSDLQDLAANGESQRAMTTVVNVFSYGFIILISLIAMTNVFNTISTSIALRRREFGMLRSVGLTQGAFARMMDYECLIYGLRALLWGLPVSALVTYAIYRTMAKTISTGFYIPWYSVAIAVGSVFVVVFATMLYATRRIRRENPIDALKQENL